VINTNLPSILHRFQVMAVIRQIFASERGVPNFNAIAWGDPGLPRFLQLILIVSSTPQLSFVTVSILCVGCLVIFWGKMDLQWMPLLQHCFVLVFMVRLTLALAAVFTWSCMTSKLTVQLARLHLVSYLLLHHCCWLRQYDQHMYAYCVSHKRLIFVGDSW